jgi:hypothetical protein
MYFTIDWVNLPFFKSISRNWIETGTNGVPCTFRLLCTFGCTFYFHFWKYKVHPKVHYYVGINIFLQETKKGNKVHLKGAVIWSPGTLYYEMTSFCFLSVGVPTDRIFWHTFCISNFKILKIGQFCNTK